MARTNQGRRQARHSQSLHVAPHAPNNHGAAVLLAPGGFPCRLQPLNGFCPIINLPIVDRQRRSASSRRLSARCECRGGDRPDA
jgi:hypothetical protein